ncbi:MAG: septum site-determining protein MinD [Anaerolineae bacterium]|jgi:septum site-determining protein MinD|nr:septum site-determining protein MinD [Anaerolineae bacterium]
MPGKIITVSSGKGGVGKTTTTANLSIALAMLGYRVTCIDADIGLRNLDVMLGLESHVYYDIINYVEGHCRLRQAMIRDTRYPELSLLPAAQTRGKEALKVEDMVRVAHEAAEMAQFVIIDSPAGIEHGFRYATAPADLVLVVTNPEVTALRDADRVIGLLEADGYAPAQLILNRYNPELVRKNGMLSAETVVDLLAVDLIGIVPEDSKVLAASNQGQPVALDDRSAAGRAFRDIARRLSGEDVPIEALQERKFLRKLFGSRRKELA